MGACVSSYRCGRVVPEKRGRRLRGSASRLPECQQRKGTSLRHAETVVVFTVQGFWLLVTVTNHLEWVSQTMPKIIFIPGMPLLR